jgi:hypothetical protein
MLAWWYYLLKAWATQSPRDALDITRDMITGSGKWGDTKSSTMSGTYVTTSPHHPHACGLARSVVRSTHV